MGFAVEDKNKGDRELVPAFMCLSVADAWEAEAGQEIASVHPRLG